LRTPPSRGRVLYKQTFNPLGHAADWKSCCNITRNRALQKISFANFIYCSNP